MEFSNPWILLGLGWALMALFMTALFLVQKVRNDAGIVDVGWAGGMALLALAFAIFADSDLLRRAIVGGLAAIWGTRLAWHLLTDRFLKGPEDGRYQDMRRAMGKHAQPGFFLFFQVQALWAVMFSVPVLVAILNPAPGLSLWVALGVLIWVIAVVGETIADEQLKAFKRKPENKGKTCRSGLWRYSRHPNYFFEWVHWFAYVAFAIGSPVWWIALAGPLVMFVFLFKVTGIPWVEKRALEHRGEDYRRYQRETSVFFPLPPKESRS